MEDAQQTYDYDFFVLGAGSGGVRASRIAGRTGARVAICEESRVGGTCVLRGCIPKKFLVYASHYSHDVEDSHNFGWDFRGKSFDWSVLQKNKNAELDRLNGIYKSLLSGAGVKLIEGRGTIVDAHTVQVGEARYTAKYILIATGSWPFLPSIPGIEHAITSNEALELTQLPKRILIVGGGYIACEFAGIFNGLGVEVTQMYRGKLVLRGFDEDLRKCVQEEMQKDGIKFILEENITKITKTESGSFECTMLSGETIDTDLVMFATGRLPNTKNLGLENAGVKINEKSAVAVDEWSRSNVESIYAVGDATDRINLTPVALAEGHAVADTLFGNNPRVFDHSDVASAVFTIPPAACVGLNEEQAAKAFDGQIDVYISKFTPLKHTISKRSQKTMVKVIVDRKTDRVLGCHMVGEDAPEIMQGLAIAIKCNATKKQFDATIGIHPSAAEEFVTLRTKRE